MPLRRDESKSMACCTSTFATFLILIISSVAEGFIPSSCSATSNRRQQSQFWSYRWPTFCINNNAACPSSGRRAALYVTSLDSDGEIQTQDWMKSYRFKDEELANKTRPQFAILHSPIGEDDSKPLVYLDSAATSQKPNCVIDTMTRYYQRTNSNVHRGSHTLSREATNMYEAARDQVAEFVHAKSRNEIIFTSGATDAINLVAYSWGRTNLRPGDEIILTVVEHHSNIVPWQIIAEQTGAVIKYVPIIKSPNTVGEELDWEGSFQEILSKNTKLVSFQHASNVLGNVNPVQDIVQMIKSKASPNCKIMLDACQSVPHIPVDVQALEVDFLAASGHKMCGPTGIGFLWAREELLNSMPPFKGGGEMINEVFLTHSTYALSPGRFEAGTPVRFLHFFLILYYFNKMRAVYSTHELYLSVHNV